LGLVAGRFEGAAGGGNALLAHRIVLEAAATAALTVMVLGCSVDSTAVFPLWSADTGRADCGVVSNAGAIALSATC